MKLICVCEPSNIGIEYTQKTEISIRKQEEMRQCRYKITIAGCKKRGLAVG
jgi:hypothetical protein